VNLTERQQGLLRLLVSNQKSLGDGEFYFARSVTGAGISYEGGKSVPAVADETDFEQLRSERFISFVRLPKDVLRGKATQLGISIVGANHPVGSQHSAVPQAFANEPSKLPELPQQYMKLMKTDAAESVERARGQLGFMKEAVLKLADSPAADRPGLEAERDRRLENAKVHVKLAADYLFDGFAEESWKAVRPDAEYFSMLLPLVSTEVANVVVCPGLDSIIADAIAARSAKWAEKTAGEAPVRNSGQWAELRAKFAELARQETDIFGQVTDDHLLRAHGTYTIGLGDLGRWSLIGSAEGIREEFILYATRAAIALGAPNDTDLLSYWLHSLFLDLLEHKSKHLFCAKRGESGMIRVLLEASVVYCSRLEQIAVENDHRRKTASSRHEGNEAPASNVNPDRAGDRETIPAALQSTVLKPEPDEVPLRAVLNVSLISAWMVEEGWTNKTLAEKLQMSERAISSLRNNGCYHGVDAITKLANLMGRDPEELYLP
jgi:hypothetical protein